MICSFPRQSRLLGLRRALPRRAGSSSSWCRRATSPSGCGPPAPGIGAFFCPTGVGTPLAEGKETREIDGRDLRAGVPDPRRRRADQGAPRRDRMGNLVYRKTARNFGPVMATAATTDDRPGAPRSSTIGGLDPEVVVTPGIYVDRVVDAASTEHDPSRRAHRPRAAGPRRAGRGRRRDIPPASFVNLGIGQPTMVADHLDPRAPGSCCTPRTACSAWARRRSGDEVDPDLTNAGKVPVTELPGASYFHHADSFAMMRGGHLDVCVLGAFQVSAARRPGQLAHRRAGRDPRGRRRDGPRDRRQAGLRDDDAVRQGRHAQAGAGVHLPADRGRLRRPGLHRPRGVRARPRTA